MVDFPSTGLALLGPNAANALLMAAEAVVYFAALAALFRARTASASAPSSARSG